MHCHRLVNSLPSDYIIRSVKSTGERLLLKLLRRRVKSAGIGSGRLFVCGLTRSLLRHAQSGFWCLHVRWHLLCSELRAALVAHVIIRAAPGVAQAIVEACDR